MLRVRYKKENLTFITATPTRYFSETFWLPFHVNNSLWRGRFLLFMSYPRSPAKFPLCCNPSRAVCIQGTSINISKPGLRALTLPFLMPVAAAPHSCCMLLLAETHASVYNFKPSCLSQWQQRDCPKGSFKSTNKSSCNKSLLQLLYCDLWANLCLWKSRPKLISQLGVLAASKNPQTISWRISFTNR